VTCNDLNIAGIREQLFVQCLKMPVLQNSTIYLLRLIILTKFCVLSLLT